jgi:iron complex transport system substrate-binding protein
LVELDIHKYLTADPFTSIQQAEEIADRLADQQNNLR